MTVGNLSGTERSGALITVVLVTVTVTIALTAQVLAGGAVSHIRAGGCIVAVLMWLGSVGLVGMALRDRREAAGAVQLAVAHRALAQSIYRCCADGLLTAFLGILYLMPENDARVFFRTHPLFAYSLIFIAIILLVVNEVVELWWRRLFLKQFTMPEEREL